MSRTLILALAAILLTACNPAEEEDASAEVLNAYDAELAELQEAVDTYVAGVATAADVSAVSALQTAYDTDADHAIEEIGHVLDDVEACSHEGDGAARVLDAKASLVVVHEDLEDMLAAHALHTEVSDCVTGSDAHAQMVASELTEMERHVEGWSEMMCQMHDDEGEAPHTD